MSVLERGTDPVVVGNLQRQVDQPVGVDIVFPDPPVLASAVEIAQVVQDNHPVHIPVAYPAQVAGDAFLDIEGIDMVIPAGKVDDISLFIDYQPV